MGDSGVADVWRYDRVKGVEIEGRANMNLGDDKQVLIERKSTGRRGN